MDDMAHDQSPEEQVSANDTDGAIEANPFSAPEAPVEAVVPPSTEGFDAIELASLKTCKTGFKLLFMAAMIGIFTIVLLVLGGFILPADLVDKIFLLVLFGVVPLIGLLSIIGDGMLITAPVRSNAKKLYQLSFACKLAFLAMPFVGFDFLGDGIDNLGGGNPLNFIVATLKGALVMFLITNALALVSFITWCLGTNRLMTFVNEPVNAARALSLLNLFYLLCGLWMVGMFVNGGAIVLVLGLASLVVSIVLAVRLITTFKGGKDAIARMLG